MPYYQLSAPLQPLPEPPSAWDRVLAVLTPEAAAAAPLPEQLKPPSHPVSYTHLTLPTT